ncbi:hypothetical protein QBC41DRAFT_322826 [Cercophora samala]|uniref:Uncharacterized protein n=1 Tax=Cercophora samala TaxID=330535 RepID=A0AA40DAK8_9PEZI|nr:hypothetical protein QBC41DRAFT_322826 [Cercophora samala]
MSSKYQEMAIKIEEHELGVSRIYLHSVTVPGIPSASRQFNKPCSYPYTSGTSSQRNEIPLALLRSILSDRLPAKATNVALQWGLTGNTDSSYPIFTTPHKITDTTSTASAESDTIVFADPLDRAQMITSNHQRQLKSQHDARAHLKISNLAPSLLTGAGKISQHQQYGISKRRRRGQTAYSQQPCPRVLEELRRHAEQHNKATGDVNCLLQVMKVQQYIMSGRSGSTPSQQRANKPRPLSPSTTSVCSEC